MNNCNEALKLNGLSYPRTCKICKFGVCQFKPVLIERDSTNQQIYKLILNQTYTERMEFAEVVDHINNRLSSTAKAIQYVVEIELKLKNMVTSLKKETKGEIKNERS